MGGQRLHRMRLTGTDGDEGPAGGGCRGVPQPTGLLSGANANTRHRPRHLVWWWRPRRTGTVGGAKAAAATTQQPIATHRRRSRKR